MVPGTPPTALSSAALRATSRRHQATRRRARVSEARDQRHAASADDEARLSDWLSADRHGTMRYMQRHGSKRSRPAELVPGTTRVISARMDYWPERSADAHRVLADPSARLHRALRARPRLSQSLAAPPAQPRTSDRGTHRAVRLSRVRRQRPVLEKALARQAGLGWVGKHTNLLDREAGSWFLLGELFTDLPLPIDRPSRALRLVPRLFGRLPYTSDRRAVSARRATLRFVSHDRAAWVDPRTDARADRQPNLRLRRLPALLPLEQVCHADGRTRLRATARSRRRRTSSSFSVGAKRNGPSAPRAARFAGPAMRAGCETSPSRSATHRPSL